MTTRSTLNYSLQAEGLQRLSAALGTSARASTTPVQSASSNVSSASQNTPAQSAISSLAALLTVVEQKFILLKECSKAAIIVWLPNYLTYKNQGGGLVHWHNVWIHQFKLLYLSYCLSHLLNFLLLPRKICTCPLLSITICPHSAIITI